MDIQPGFIVYKNGYGPVWVCPHSGPAFENPFDRDENSEVVASLCWMKTGGSLIISTIPRHRAFGIDFNRDAPERNTSNLLWEEFEKNPDSRRVKQFEENYAWLSKNVSDFRSRQKIYENFWKTIRLLGNIIIFIHREHTFLPNFPSIMEIITYQGEGVNKEIVKAIVNNINKKYEDFFKDVSNHYKHTVLLEELRFIDRIKMQGSKFDIKEMSYNQKRRLGRSFKVIENYSDKKVTQNLIKNFNEKNYVSAVGSVLRKNIHPIVTIENRFRGDKALKMKKLLLNRRNIVMEIESSSFINYWHPVVAKDIIIDLLNELVSVDMYKRMGMKQTQIMKFIKSEQPL
jgi:hypothetical protein